MSLTQLRNLGIVANAGISTTKLGAGAVLQVVTATDTTERSTSSTSFVTGSNALSVSITPSSASNKILILVSSTTFVDADQNGFYTIFRGATDLGAASNKGFVLSRNGNVNCPGTLGINFLDSPNTTSATTYQVYFRAVANTAYLNWQATKGSITAFEIAG